MAGEAISGRPVQGTVTEALTTTGGAVAGLEGPLRGFRFTAEFDGLGTTSFKSVTGGFSASVDNNPYREGAFPHLTSRKLPGLVTYDDIQLEKGLYKNAVLYSFFNSYLNGQNITPVNATITIYDNAGNPTASWIVMNAWPVSYRSQDLSADDSSILIESLTLAHEGIERVLA